MDRYQRQLRDLLERTRNQLNLVLHPMLAHRIPKVGTFEADNRLAIETLTQSVRALEAAVRTIVEEQEETEKKQRLAKYRIQKSKKSGSFSWPS